MDPLRSEGGGRPLTALTFRALESRPFTDNQWSDDGALPLFPPLSISEMQP
jgi:hypothetical protein